MFTFPISFKLKSLISPQSTGSNPQPALICAPSPPKQVFTIKFGESAINRIVIYFIFFSPSHDLGYCNGKTGLDPQLSVTDLLDLNEYSKYSNKCCVVSYTKQARDFSRQTAKSQITLGQATAFNVLIAYYIRQHLKSVSLPDVIDRDIFCLYRNCKLLGAVSA